MGNASKSLRDPAVDRCYLHPKQLEPGWCADGVVSPVHISQTDACRVWWQADCELDDLDNQLIHWCYLIGHWEELVQPLSRLVWFINHLVLLSRPSSLHEPVQSREHVQCCGARGAASRWLWCLVVSGGQPAACCKRSLPHAVEHVQQSMGTGERAWQSMHAVEVVCVQQSARVAILECTRPTERIRRQSCNNCARVKTSTVVVIKCCDI